MTLADPPMPTGHANSHAVSKSADRDDFLPSDIPHDVVIQEALAPFFGGFEEAEEASKMVHRALVVTYGRAIVEADDARKVAALAAHYMQFMEPERGEFDAVRRVLRAALPERNDHV